MMKKSLLILASFLLVALGIVLFAFGSSASSDEPTLLGANGFSAGEGKFSYNNAYQNTAETVVSGTDPYLLLDFGTAPKVKTSGNVNPYWAFADGAGKYASDYTYVAYELDVGTLSHYFSPSTGRINLMSDWRSAENQMVFVSDYLYIVVPASRSTRTVDDPAYLKVVDNGTEATKALDAGVWDHITVLVRVDERFENGTYCYADTRANIYLNGEYVGSANICNAKATSSRVKMQAGFRMDASNMDALAAGNIAMDNYAFYGYTDANDDAIAAAFDSHADLSSVPTASYHLTEKRTDLLSPSVATYNGTRYCEGVADGKSTLSEVLLPRLAADGGSLELLADASTDGKYVFSQTKAASVRIPDGITWTVNGTGSGALFTVKSNANLTLSGAGTLRLTDVAFLAAKSGDPTVCVRGEDAEHALRIVNDNSAAAPFIAHDGGAVLLENVAAVPTERAGTAPLVRLCQNGDIRNRHSLTLSGASLLHKGTLVEVDAASDVSGSRGIGTPILSLDDPGDIAFGLVVKETATGSCIVSVKNSMLSTSGANAFCSTGGSVGGKPSVSFSLADSSLRAAKAIFAPGSTPKATVGAGCRLSTLAGLGEEFAIPRNAFLRSDGTDADHPYSVTALSDVVRYMNMTLFADFSLNLYLDPSFTDEIASVTFGDREAVTALDELPTETIGDKTYYKLSYTGIDAKNAVETVSYSLLLKDGQRAFGSASVVDYAKAVLKMPSLSESHDLMIDMLGYVKESVAYFTGESNDEIAAILAAYPRSVAPENYTGVSLGDIGSVFTGARFDLGDRPEFRFGLKSGYMGKVTLSCGETARSYSIENGLCDGKNYVDFPVGAHDLYKTVSVSASGVSGAYSLANYINAMKEDAVLPLAKAMYVYAKSAAFYADPENAEETLGLFDGKTALFRIVTTSEAGAEAESAALSFAKSLQNLGYTVAAPVSDAEPAAVCEIVIGTNVKGREGCTVLKSGLGAKDFVIRTVGDRVVIAGGSSKATAAGVAYFVKNILLVDETGAMMKKTVRNDLHKLSETPVAATFTVDGLAISEYSLIVADTKLLSYAETLRDALYRYTGAWLDVENSDAGVAHPFYVRLVKDAGGTGFRIINRAGELSMECEFENTFARSVEGFIRTVLETAAGEVTLDAGESYTQNANELYYSDFGAKGDGVTDDFAALYLTHEAANRTGQKVRPDENGGAGKTYYVGSFNKTIPVKTDVDFGSARFIIDDTKVDEVNTTDYTVALFTVKSDYSSETYGPITCASLTIAKGQTNVGLTFPYDCLIRPINENHRIFIRYGANANSGSYQQEILLVDRDGNIDPSTPPMWDYGEITKMVVTRIDDRPITVEGGTFTTIASPCSSLAETRDKTIYFNRGITISRSNVTVKNVDHFVTGEPDDWGASYGGFINVNDANHITIVGCSFWGHKTYYERTETAGGGVRLVGSGTYDTNATNANDVTWKDCTQNNSVIDESRWGVHASNFCKNLSMIGCTVSRFDAHQGVWNATVKDSYIGITLSCVGGGLLTCENTTVRCPRFISLRSDYGSTWNGDATLVDCTLETDNAYPCVFSGEYTANHDFGYRIYLPENIVLDHFRYTKTDGTAGDRTLYVFWDVPKSALTDPVNPYEVTKTITFRNMKAIPSSMNYGKTNDAFTKTRIIVE